MQVKREIPLYEQIYIKLRDSILHEEIKPGERLVDSRIAGQLKVSRGPVREAFRKLEQEGLITNSEGIIEVYVPSLQDVLELYQVRVGLEAVSVYWATHYMTKEQLDELYKSLLETEKAVKLKNLPEVIKLNTYFHESIVSYSKNKRLQLLMSNIRSLVFLYRNTIFNQYNRDHYFLSEHRGILDAIKEREPSLAAKRMELHIYNDMNHFKEYFLMHKEKEAELQNIKKHTE
ncbi:GntR family transcriptional regulator [Peribacillus saganii]|uniref:GntR family transcriptional regulator n=1 Tax=Peribacillus saganii TaxID=2303992 RepID=A0A372LTD4_9BACI|nr:GntR family transcriptional regulator [Peribacillus saganii]RFU71475.1 GntR family transcriptional regulator [Peribacillus saganii]